MAGDQRGVDVQVQAGQFPSAGRRRWYAAAGLGCLQPGDFPGLGACRAQAVQYVFVDGGQQPPGSRCRGDRAEHLALVAQHAQIRGGLTAVSHCHGEVVGDPARVMTGASWPERSQRGGVRTGQSGDIGEIRPRLHVSADGAGRVGHAGARLPAGVRAEQQTTEWRPLYPVRSGVKYVVDAFVHKRDIGWRY